MGQVYRKSDPKSARAPVQDRYFMAATTILEACSETNRECIGCPRLARCQKLQSWLCEECSDGLLLPQTMLAYLRRFLKEVLAN